MDNTVVNSNTYIKCCICWINQYLTDFASILHPGNNINILPLPRVCLCIWYGMFFRAPQCHPTMPFNRAYFRVRYGNENWTISGRTDEYKTEGEDILQQNNKQEAENNLDSGKFNLVPSSSRSKIRKIKKNLYRGTKNKARKHCKSECNKLLHSRHDAHLTHKLQVVVFICAFCRRSQRELDLEEFKIYIYMHIYTIRPTPKRSQIGDPRDPRTENGAPRPKAITIWPKLLPSRSSTSSGRLNIWWLAVR